MFEKKHRFRLLPLLISLLITLSIGGSAGFFTAPQTKGWYLYLIKPVFNPPNWIFAPVWTALYIMIAIAAYLVWQRRQHALGYTTAKFVYFIQLFLNFSWSIVFFGLHQVFGALIIIALLFVSIVCTIRLFGNINKAAGWLLFPYLLWVSFAGMLNFSIYLLNR